MTPQTTQGASPLLRSGSFLLLWIGTTASGLATWAMPFLLGLAVLDGSITAAGLGLVLAARTVGFLVSVPVGGVLADRHSRRGVVLCAGLAAAVATPIMVAGLGVSLPITAAAAAVVGAGQGACRPAFQALTAEVVAPENRQRANAAITFSVRVATLLGPGLAALLSTFVGTSPLLLATGALWLAAALLPRSGQRRPEQQAQRRALLTEFVDGWTEARRHPWFLAGLAALTAVIATGYSATGVLLPLASKEYYGTEMVLAGALTAYTAGALIGAVVVARWSPAARGWASLVGLGLYGFAPLSLVVPLDPLLVIAAYVVAGVGIELFNVPWFTAAQREVEPGKLARVSSLDFLFSYGMAPVGLAVIAPAAHAFGMETVLFTCALVCFAAPALACLAPGAKTFSTPASVGSESSGNRGGTVRVPCGEQSGS